MQPAPRFAIAVGPEPDCYAVETFRSLTVAAGFKFRHRELPRKALRDLEEQPMLGEARTLILLCTKPADATIVETVAAFATVRQGADIIVYADGAHWSGELAVHCLQANARDFLVHGIHDRILSRQIGLAKHGQPPYARFENPVRRGPAFIAMAYDPIEAYQDLNCGILPAMEALGMQPFLSSDQHGVDPLPTAVERQIRDSTLLIANITRYGRGNNANVAEEIGVAKGGRIPVIIAKRRGDKGIYTNLKGEQLLHYDSCADLATQLYIGLRGAVRDP